MSFDNLGDTEWNGIKDELTDESAKTDFAGSILLTALQQQKLSKSISTDTSDLEIEECNGKNDRCQVLTCSIAIDTSDLEAHYEYYRHNYTKNSRTISTDTQDLDDSKLKVFKSIGIGTDCISEPEPDDAKKELDALKLTNVKCELEVEEEEEVILPNDSSDDSDWSESEKKPIGIRKLRSCTKPSPKKKLKPGTKTPVKRKPVRAVSYEIARVDVVETAIEEPPKLRNRIALRKVVEKPIEEVKLKSEEESGESSDEDTGSNFSTGFVDVDNDPDYNSDEVEEQPVPTKDEKKKSPVKKKLTEGRPPRVKRFGCLTCGKRFHGRNDLRDHETVHTGVRDYACDICKKSFTTRTILKAHEIVHTDLQPFQCEICQKRFRRNDSLRAHMRAHDNHRPFKCDLCPMAFTRMFTLKNHRVTHSGEKSHICPKCGKGFATRGGLGTHERTRHNPDLIDKPRKPYTRRERDFTPCVCEECGKVYSNQSNLRIHKYVHSGERNFACSACGMAFATKYTLQCHARKHTNERPFVCETCGQTFYRNSTLKTHKLKHTGEKPHPCPLCGKCFRQRCSLRYHIMHHNRATKPVNPSGKKRRRKKPSEESGNHPAAPQPPHMYVSHPHNDALMSNNMMGHIGQVNVAQMMQ